MRSLGMPPSPIRHAPRPLYLSHDRRPHSRLPRKTARSIPAMCGARGTRFSSLMSPPRTATVASEGPPLLHDERARPHCWRHRLAHQPFPSHMWQQRTRRASWAPSSPHSHAVNTKYPINLRGGDSASPTPQTRTAWTSRPSDLVDAPREEALAMTQCTRRLRQNSLRPLWLRSGIQRATSGRTQAGKKEQRCCEIARARALLMHLLVPTYTRLSPSYFPFVSTACCNTCFT